MSAKNKISGIYRIVHVETGKKYIGRSIDIHRRVKEHQVGGNGLIARVIAEYGWGAFVWEVLEECPLEKLQEIEILWIANEDCIYPKGFNLLSAGGNANKTSEETLKKMSLAQKGKKQTKEQIEKRIASRLASPEGRGYKLSPETIAKREATKKAMGLKGYKWSEEQKAAKSKQMTGKKATLETREKLSEAHKGKPRSPEIRKAISIGRIRENKKRKDLEAIQQAYDDRVQLEFPEQEAA